MVSLSCKIYQLQILLVLLELLIIMDDITKFFRSSSKKRDLSDTSKTDEDPKKIREASSASFADEGDVFNEGIDSSGCREILFNCLKNLEAKVMEIYEQGNENKNMHIKGEKQLVDLAESVKFMTSKFDELEKDRKEKEKIINNLKGEVSYLSEKLGKLEESIDAQQQYSRRNCLLLHGIEETKGEDTDDLVLEVLNDDMGLNISKTALDRSHRIGNPKTKKKSRPIIVKFVRYYDRRDVFVNKKCLKGKGKSITESLTAFRMQKLKNARDEHGFFNVWTVDGKIMFKNSENGKPNVYYD